MIRIVTTTISGKQREHVAARVRAAGLEDRVTVLREDYRDLPRRVGRRFRKLVSIEMIEAVGHEYLETYFRACADLLEPFEAAIDDLALFAFDLYLQCREKIYDIKAKEAQSATFRLLQQAKILTERQE